MASTLKNDIDVNDYTEKIYLTIIVLKLLFFFIILLYLLCYIIFIQFLFLFFCCGVILSGTFSVSIYVFQNPFMEIIKKKMNK